jgi:hypothetical protein
VEGINMGFVLPAIGAGLSLYEGITGASQQRKLGEATAKSIEEQMRLLNEQRKKLGEAYEGRRNIVTDVYGNKVSSLVDRVGQTLQTIGMETDFNLGKSGLAYSGTLRKREDLTRKRVGLDYSSEQRSLYDTMRSQLADIRGSELREQGDIDTKLTQLQGELEVANIQKQSKFLGIF